MKMPRKAFLTWTLLYGVVDRVFRGVIERCAVPEPYLVMAALIGLADAWSFVRNGECTMLTYFPSFLSIWGVEESTHLCPHTRNRTVGKGLFNDTDTQFR